MECVKPVDKRMFPLNRQMHSSTRSISTAENANPFKCPPYPMGHVGAALFCQTGYDCQASRKCCMTKVGHHCTAPMEDSTTANQKQPQKSPA
ncbi:hypothetical protein M513_14394 [Trichuris suis]|uniref:WAP domain-containing protein n=1 Tax=Trichuris suis TaxID=68888 RepID=A0A085LID3_9BILA|nr:hypothetical protein M513_14394 [Trichuris suis]